MFDWIKKGEKFEIAKWQQRKDALTRNNTALALKCTVLIRQQMSNCSRSRLGNKYECLLMIQGGSMVKLNNVEKN